MRFYNWLKSLAFNLFVPRLTRAPRRTKRRPSVFERLEGRAVLATYGITGTTLNIDLNTPGENIQIYPDANDYRIRLNGASANIWTAQSGASTDGLTVTTFDQTPLPGGGVLNGSDLTADYTKFDTVNITDSASNTRVYFLSGSNDSISDSFNIKLDNNSAGIIFPSESLTTYGNYNFLGSTSLSIDVDHSVEFDSWNLPRRWTFNDGNLDMRINMQQTPRDTTKAGLFLRRSVIETLGTGQTNIIAKGGNGSGSNFQNRGVAVINGAKIIGGTTGTMNITGYAFPHANATGWNACATGVAVSGNATLYAGSVNVNFSEITSHGANVVVTGYGANKTNALPTTGSNSGTMNAGVALGHPGGPNNDTYNGTISSGGNGSVTVIGYGGSVSNPPSGTVANRSSPGVYLNGSGALIKSGGSGLVTVTGFGGGAQVNTSCSVGVSIYNGKITSGTDGSVEVRGTGSATGSANFHHGIWMRGASGLIAAGVGTGSTTVVGTGGGCGTGISSYGVNLTAGAKISALGSGNVSVTGTGGGSTGTGTDHIGVSVSNGAMITAAGSGSTVTVSGIGGGGSNATATNHGISLSGVTAQSNQTITSNTGLIELTATEGTGSGSLGLAMNLTSPTVIGNATAAGNVRIFTDSASIATTAGSAINASGQILIAPRTAGVTVNLTSTTDTPNGPLSLSNAELATFNAGTIQVGNATTGNVTIGSGLTVPSASNLTLVSNATGSSGIVSNGTITLGAGKLLNITGPASVNAIIDGTTAQTQYSQVSVVGDLNIAGATLNLSGSYTPASGEAFTIVEATTLTGTFAGLPAGATITLNGRVMAIIYSATSVTLTDPTITVSSTPSDSTVTAGNTASFTSTATGSPPPTVKWQSSSNGGTTWTDIAGETGTTLSFTAAAGDDGKQYRAVFSNGYGSDIPTSPATLTVQVAPAITSTNAATFAAGLTESFQVVATGNPAVTYSITSGSLPSGVTLDPTTGALSGKAAMGSAGAYPVTISASNGVGTAATQAFTLTVVNQITSTQVSRGQVQRSYLRYIDLAMSSNSVAALLATNSATRMKLIKSDLNGNNPSEMSLAGLVSSSGSAVTIDFGAAGIGGSRNTNQADGYYALKLDMDGDGAFETTFNFYRLFGDTNGDKKVDQADINNVTAGMSAYSVESDLNGDGRVNTTDLLHTRRALNRALNASLPLG